MGDILWAGLLSRPVRARGLKHENLIVPMVGLMSRPVRARGLKLRQQAVKCIVSPVAPRAGAWIETHPLLRRYKR